MIYPKSYQIFKIIRKASLCAGIATYMWSMAYVKDVKTNLKAINEIAGRKNQQAEFKPKFLDAHFYHSVGIELSINGLSDRLKLNVTTSKPEFKLGFRFVFTEL